jgi:hypothetical protein
MLSFGRRKTSHGTKSGEMVRYGTTIILPLAINASIEKAE